MDWEEYARQWREFPSQFDDDGNCLYCHEERHGCRVCYYLSKTPPANWTPLPDLWRLSFKKTGDQTDRVNMVITHHESESDSESETETETEDIETIPTSSFVGLARPPTPTTPWINDSGAGVTICSDLNDMVEYTPYKKGDKRYQYETAAGSMVDTDGYGFAMIKFDLGDGLFNTLIVKSFYRLG
jgi:hypothetical protein